MYPLVHVSSQLVIPTYVLILSAIFSLSVFVVVKRAQRLNVLVSTALDLTLAIMIGAFVGARLLHVFYEMPEYYLAHPLAIFAVWEGGFVFYGGLAGALILGILVAQKKRVSVLLWCDFFAPLGALGYALGRFACFAAGCCYGKPTELPWALVFPTVDSFPRHPTQLYASAWELITFLILVALESLVRREKIKAAPVGSLFLIWLILHASGRLLMEHFRDDLRGPAILDLSISTWLSGLIGVAAIITLVVNYLRPVSAKES